MVGAAVPLPVPTHAGAPGPTESPPVGRGGGNGWKVTLSL